MSNNNTSRFDEKWSQRLETLFRNAVRLSKSEHYVYFTDRAANNDVTILPDFVLQDAKGRWVVIEAKKSTKKSA